MSSGRRRSSWAKKRDTYVYLGLIAAAILLAGGIRLASEFTLDVNFMFLALVVLLLVAIIVVAARKMK
jgi:hypothetical protein